MSNVATIQVGELSVWRVLDRANELARKAAADVNSYSTLDAVMGLNDYEQERVKRLLVALDALTDSVPQHLADSIQLCALSEYTKTRRGI